jgi:1,4-dihydroxy-2-naphthoate octaprenyltransferase
MCCHTLFHHRTWQKPLTMNRFSTLLALVRLGRLHFLVGGFLLHGLGILMAVYAGAKLNLTALIWGQIAITATQVMTHYANDYFDLDADRANATPTNWSGGSRVLIEGQIATSTALYMALSFGAIGLFANVILSLFVRPGLPTFLLLLTAHALAWFYSAPPVRLHSRGLGEITTAIIVTLLTPLTGFYLHFGQITALPLLAVIPLCCFQIAMLLSIEFPDAAGDQRVGKRTLVVWLGDANAARLYVVLIAAAYLLLPVLVKAGLPTLAAIAILLPTPLALWQLGRALRGDWRILSRWNRFAFYTIVLLMTTAAAEFGAFVLLIGLQPR